MGTKGSQPGKSLLVSCLPLMMMQGRGLHCLLLLLDEVDKGCVKLEKRCKGSLKNILERYKIGCSLDHLIAHQ